MKKIHLVEKEDDSDPLKNSVVDDRVEDCPEIELCNNYRDEDDGVLCSAVLCYAVHAYGSVSAGRGKWPFRVI